MLYAVKQRHDCGSFAARCVLSEVPVLGQLVPSTDTFLFKLGRCAVRVRLRDDKTDDVRSAKQACPRTGLRSKRSRCPLQKLSYRLVQHAAMQCCRRLCESAWQDQNLCLPESAPNSDSTLLSQILPTTDPLNQNRRAVRGALRLLCFKFERHTLTDDHHSKNILSSAVRPGAVI